jgi:hypothetical protein
MFNIREHQYAISGNNKSIISWYNKEISYPKILFDKTKKEFMEKNDTNFHDNQYEYDPPKFYNKCTSAWAKITNEGKVVISRNTNHVSSHDAFCLFSKKAKQIFSTWNAFAALLKDDSVVTWGAGNNGGKIPKTIKNQLQNVKMIFSTDCAFAALLQNG